MHTSLRRTRWIVGVWLLVALFFSAQGALVHISRGAPIDWQWDVFHEFVYCLMWAALTPAILDRAARWPLERGSLARVLPRHLVAMLLIAIVQIVATYAFHGLLLAAAGFLPAVRYPAWLWDKRAGFVWGSFTGSLYYWTIAAVYWAAAFQRMYRDQKLAAAQLGASLTAARLDALRAQLQPHFLFNTLNAVSVLTEVDPPRARRMLLRLADLLRQTLEQASGHEVTLRREVSVLEGYLDIERVRFEERLQVQLEVEDEAWDALVPAFLLQPLVENAIRHGVAPSVAGGRVVIRARRDGESLALEVEDNGPGLPDPGAPLRNGVGLANTRARLAELYGGRERLELVTPAAGGLVVSLRLPFRVA